MNRLIETLTNLGDRPIWLEISSQWRDWLHAQQFCTTASVFLSVVEQFSNGWMMARCEAKDGTEYIKAIYYFDGVTVQFVVMSATDKELVRSVGYASSQFLQNHIQQMLECALHSDLNVFKPVERLQGESFVRALHGMTVEQLEGWRDRP